MVAPLALSFAVVLVFEIIAAGAVITALNSSNPVIRRSLEQILAAIVFLGCAATTRVVLHLGTIGLETTAVLESYFYALAFLNIVIATLGWRTTAPTTVAELNHDIKEFYGAKE